MMETLEYIEAYFQQTLSEEEKQNFLVRCEQDKDFAEEVAFYITSRQVIKETLLQQKQGQWKEKNITEEKLSFKAPVKKLYQRQWFMYAAACLVLAVSVYIFEKPINTQQIAKEFINQNYTQLSLTMDGNIKDSIQLGIAAYNNKNYNKALQFFEPIQIAHPDNNDAIKYTGIVYLVTDNYDKALQQFDKLAAKPGQFNPGDFLKAVTLMKRNNPDDKKEAQKLLHKVVTEKEEYNREAGEWLKKF